MTPTGGPALRVCDLVKTFDGFTALDRVSFEVSAGESVGIIGPNGAGKSTLFDLLTGRKQPDSGRVYLHGSDVTRSAPWDRVRRGLGRSFQVSSVFPSYTVLQNVQAGLVLSGGKSWDFMRAAFAQKREEARALLETVGLAEQEGVVAGELPYGDQRTLDLAMALSTKPRLLLLDEPTAGMGRDESRACLALIKHIANVEQLPVIFVEHDMDVVFGFASRVIVLVAGQVLVDGDPQQVRADLRVQEAYFGEQL